MGHDGDVERYQRIECTMSEEIEESEKVEVEKKAREKERLQKEAKSQQKRNRYLP